MGPRQHRRQHRRLLPRVLPRRRPGGHGRAEPRRARLRSSAWRALTPLVLLAAGVLFVTSMVSSGGTDLRAGRYDDLDGLATSEAHQLEALRARTVALSDQVDTLTRDLGSGTDTVARRRLAALQGPAGMTPVSGRGVTITLDDAPASVRASAGDDVSELLVHQQDIQAVANALWAGGARAMTIQGQRVIATTGIKCVGNVVILHGVPYSPPYRISAVGSPSDLVASVDASPYIALYLQLVPKGLGWRVQQPVDLHLPGYQGSTQLDYARPATAG